MSQMIVCVCNAIREDEVRAAARHGATEPVAAYKALDYEPLCGCCLDYAQEVIDDEHKKPARRNRSSVVVNFPRAA
ncbi:MAG TPA: (2Fe-2S)-binding protein [Sphingomicrobium sp.]|jgi:bacterioferritin-associated ferredoxin|nr:(2Fe-2S)-binding protein [Sphingomicrobium sp.]